MTHYNNTLIVLHLLQLSRNSIKPAGAGYGILQEIAGLGLLRGHLWLPPPLSYLPWEVSPLSPVSFELTYTLALSFPSGYNQSHGLILCMHTGSETSAIIQFTLDPE